MLSLQVCEKPKHETNNSRRNNKANRNHQLRHLWRPANKYIYTLIDNFSLFVTTIKAKTKTKEEIHSAFLQVFVLNAALPTLIGVSSTRQRPFEK